MGNSHTEMADEAALEARIPEQVAAAPGSLQAARPAFRRGARPCRLADPHARRHTGHMLGDLWISAAEGVLLGCRIHGALGQARSIVLAILVVEQPSMYFAGTRPATSVVGVGHPRMLRRSGAG